MPPDDVNDECCASTTYSAPSVARGFVYNLHEVVHTAILLSTSRRDHIYLHIYDRNFLSHSLSKEATGFVPYMRKENLVPTRSKQVSLQLKVGRSLQGCQGRAGLLGTVQTLNTLCRVIHSTTHPPRDIATKTQQ